MRERSRKILIETQLHQQLKAHYAPAENACEQQLGAFRIDVLQADELIEIQCSTLAALRQKVRALTPKYRLRIVKPVIRRTRVIKKKWSQVVSNRFNSHRGSWEDLFEELVHFVTVFPRENLTIEALLIDVEEIRRPPAGRRRNRGYRVEERSLLEIVDSVRLSEPADLFQLLPVELPDIFHTAELAEQLQRPRWFAQKVAYCLKQSGAVQVVGKQGNTVLYQRPAEKILAKAG